MSWSEVDQGAAPLRSWHCWGPGGGQGEGLEVCGVEPLQQLADERG